MSIETVQLQLKPYSPQHVLALIDGCEQFEKLFGLPAAAGLREFFVSGDVSQAWIAQLRESEVPDPWRHGFAVVLRETQSVIGTFGFKGPPDDRGVVEIGYGVVPDFQGRGFATEATRAGIEFAFASGLVRVVRAHTLATPNASTRVLAKCGFTHVGDFDDPEDGRVWRWELIGGVHV